MDEQIKFKEALDALLDLAAASDGMLTMPQVQEACSEFHLSQEQLGLVCAYLESNRVKIQDAPASGRSRELFGEPEAETARKAGGQEKAKDGDGRESAYYKMYLDELKMVGDFLFGEKEKE